MAAIVCRECQALHHRACSRECRACASCGELLSREMRRPVVVQAAAKEPWLALLLTLIAPGLGHVYAGKVGLGVAIFFGIGFAYLALLVVLPIPLSLLAILALHIWIIVDSFSSAQAANAPAWEPARRRRVRH